MPRRTPLTPIFDADIRRGAAVAGNTPGVPLAPCVPNLIEMGTLVDGADLVDPYGVDAAGTLAYVASRTSDSLTLVDFSDPSTPTNVGSVTNSNLDNARGVVYDSTNELCYVCAGTRLTVIDVSTPATPAVIGSVSDAVLNGAENIAYSGGLCYVAARDAGRLTVVDVSTPASPVISGSVTHALLDGAEGVDYDAVNEVCYVTGSSANSLVVIDVSTPATPAVIGSVVDGTDLWVPYGIAYSGGLCYVAARAAGRLTVVDVSTPASPVILGSYVYDDSLLIREPSDVVYRSGYVYVVDSTAETVSVLDVSTPSTPTLVDEITLAVGAAEWVALSSDFLVTTVATFFADGVTVIEIGCA